MVINLVKMHVHVNNYIKKIMGEACIVIINSLITEIYTRYVSEKHVINILNIQDALKYYISQC